MNGPLERLVSEARRRALRNLIADQASFAIALALVSVIGLLLIGTQILNWYWPVLLLVGAFAIGVARVLRARPDHYTIARMVDQRLNSDDLFATAWHYRLETSERAAAPIRRAQREIAESRAAEVDVAFAVPFRWPRHARVCAALLVGVAAMFAARYGVQRSLDLARPLVAFELNPFGSASAPQLAQNRQPKTPMEEFLQQVSIQPPDQGDPQGLDPAPDSALGNVDVPDVNNDNSQQPAAGVTDKKAPGNGDQDQQGEGSDQSTDGASGDPNGKEGDQKGGEKGQGQKKDGDSKSNQQNADQPGEGSSMLDKMRDALANLMNKMQKSPQAQQSQSAQKGKNQQSGNGRQQQAKQGQQSKGAQGEASQQAQNQQQADQDGGDPSQSQPGKSGDKNADASNDSQQKSGMGKQDGDKDVKLAEQMAAMGKISEIIGKRNANLQGEIMIEVNSSKQSLRTQYSNRAARQGDAGGEISRDEVPLAYHNYVQQYFDQVRKAPAGKADAAKADARPSRNVAPVETP